MNSIDPILKLFADKFFTEDFSENDKVLTCKINSSTLNIPSEDTFSSLVADIIPDRDKMIITVVIDDGDRPNVYNSQNSANKLEEFLSALSEEAKFMDDDSSIDVKVEIHKENVDNTLTIYDFDKIIDTWKNYSINNFWFCFSRVLQKNYIHFEVMQEIKPFHSQNMSFVTRGKSYEHKIRNTSDIKRKDLNEKLAQNCHFANASQCKLIPEDFYLLEKSENEDINELFTKFSLLQSLIFLFDITSVENKGRSLDYKLRGYRQISGTLRISDLITESSTEYFNIFQWVYNGGNLSDKIGLARNIISIHIKKNNPLLLAEEVLSSIKSGYDIYLKQNVSQYISTKIQVAESLQEASIRANQIAESIAVPFRNCVLAIITFFASIFVIRVSLTGNLEVLFTRDISILSMGFILISLSYLWVLRHEINEDKKRFTKNYENLKNRYEDILDSLDIKKIFNHDREYHTDLHYIDSKKRWYSGLWIITHSLLIILVLGLSWGEVKLETQNQNKITKDIQEKKISIQNKITDKSNTPQLQEKMSEESDEPKFQKKQSGVGEKTTVQNKIADKSNTPQPQEKMSEESDEPKFQKKQSGIGEKITVGHSKGI